MIEIIDSVLCDRCQNAGPGVTLKAERVCFDCCDAETVAQIVRLKNPDFAKKFDETIARQVKQENSLDEKL